MFYESVGLHAEQTKVCLHTSPLLGRIGCAPQALLLWPHNQGRRVRAGEVCDTGEREWEAKAWKT